MSSGTSWNNHDDDERIHKLEEQVAAHRRIALGAVWTAAVIGAFFLGLRLRPEPVPFQPAPGFEDMSGWNQAIILGTALGWLGLIFDAPDLFEDLFHNDKTYWVVLSLLSGTCLGLYAA